MLLQVNLCLPACGISGCEECGQARMISLAAGEKQTVSFVIKEDDLKFYDEGWKTEPGSFTLYVGSSSVDIREKAKFTLLGNK